MQKCSYNINSLQDTFYKTKTSYWKTGMVKHGLKSQTLLEKTSSSFLRHASEFISDLPLQALHSPTKNWRHRNRFNSQEIYHAMIPECLIHWQKDWLVMNMIIGAFWQSIKKVRKTNHSILMILVIIVANSDEWWPWLVTNSRQYEVTLQRCTHPEAMSGTRLWA